MAHVANTLHRVSAITTSGKGSVQTATWDSVVSIGTETLRGVVVGLLLNQKLDGNSMLDAMLLLERCSQRLRRNRRVGGPRSRHGPHGQTSRANALCATAGFIPVLRG